MPHQALVRIASVVVAFMSVSACSNNTSATDFTVRVTEQGSCEVAGERLACDSIGPKVLSLCPSARCNVQIEADAGGKSEQVVMAFKSLTELRFSRVSFSSKSGPQ
jgi:biopolymer transport protein ExbD